MTVSDGGAVLRRGIWLLGAVSALALTGCGASASVSVGTPKTLSSATVAKEVQSTLTGSTADQAKVTCGRLEAKVGATQDCDVTIAGQRTGLHLTVDRVHGSDVHWTQKPFLHGSDVAATIAKSVGASSDDLTCPDLSGKVGATATCKVLKGTAKTVSVEVTSVQGLHMNLRYHAS